MKTFIYFTSKNLQLWIPLHFNKVKGLTCALHVRIFKLATVLLLTNKSVCYTINCPCKNKTVCFRVHTNSNVKNQQITNQKWCDLICYVQIIDCLIDTCLGSIWIHQLGYGKRKRLLYGFIHLKKSTETNILPVFLRFELKWLVGHVSVVRVICAYTGT